MIKRKIEYTIKNLNKEKIFKEIIKISEIKNVKYNEETITFNVDKNKSKNIDKILEQKSAKLINKRERGLFAFFKKNVLKLGIIIPVIVFIIFIYICNFYVFNYEILGINLIEKNEIIRVLKSNGVSGVLLKNSINTKKIESEILSLSKVSLVSVIIRGNTLVVNIKEKVYNEEYEDKNNFSPLVSTADGIITELTIIQGTPLVKVGQMVKCGQELVAPYVKDTSGNILDVKPMADIKADVFYNTITELSENFITYKDTSNCTYKTEMYAFGAKIFKSGDECGYKFYRTEVEETYLGDKSAFLVKYVKTKYIEQKEVLEENYFTKNKDQIIKQCQQKTRQLCAVYEIIKDEYKEITNTCGIVRISYTIVVNKSIL